MQSDAKFTRTFADKYTYIFFESRCYAYRGYSHMLMFLMQQPSSTQAVQNRREWVGGEVLLYQKHL